jgi:uncharacterized protein (TIGR00288 family)
MLDRARRVILLIDFDNLQICASRDTPGRDLQLEPVVQLAQRYGSVIVARAYAEWNLSTERLAVYKAGIEPAFAPVLRTESDRSGKSLADTVMVAEGMDMLWTLNPDVMVLATSDKDLIPLVRVAKQRGCRVVVLGSDYTAIPLREMADEHITYKQLVTDASGRYIDGTPVRAAVTPEPARRSRGTRDREGREAAAAAAAGSAAASAPPPAPVAPPAAMPAPAEPVPPVTAGLDADGQGGTRRRRRRGSRRRSDRVGSAADDDGEGTPNDGSHQDDASPDPPLVQPQADAGPAETGAPKGAEPPTAEPLVAAEASSPESAEPTVVADGHVAASTPASADANLESASPTAETPAQPAESSDLATANGTGEMAEPAPPKRTRARRVASASRGRSRPISD